MDKNKTTNLREHVDVVARLVDALVAAKTNALLQEAEAKAILNDFLKATGFKQMPVKPVTPAPEKVEEKK